MNTIITEVDPIDRRLVRRRGGVTFSVDLISSVKCRRREPRAVSLSIKVSSQVPIITGGHNNQNPRRTPKPYILLYVTLCLLTILGSEYY